MAILDDPGKVRACLERLTEGAIGLARRQAACGVDAILISKLDKEFKEAQKKLEEKLAQEKAYEKWTYLVSSWTLDSLLKERSQMLVEQKEEKKADASPGASEPAPVLQPLPGAESTPTPGPAAAK